jgi:ubiquinone/menaquinone biosynthesis C-methylase UbiE
MGFYSERIFPILLKRATSIYEEDRLELLQHARGRVLDVGIGTGATLKWYPPGVREIVGIDPSESLLEECRATVSRLSKEGRLAAPVDLQAAFAESLPFPDESFDTAVSFLVFCSLPDPDAAAWELYRVLRPGGSLVFFEHVRDPDPRKARWQERLNPLWTRIAGGCNLHRNTRSVFERAGFAFRDLHEGHHKDSMTLTSYKMRGVAVRPGSS